MQTCTHVIHVYIYIILLQMTLKNIKKKYLGNVDVQRKLVTCHIAL